MKQNWCMKPSCAPATWLQLVANILVKPKDSWQHKCMYLYLRILGFPYLPTTSSPCSASAKVLCLALHECQGNACSLVSLEDPHSRDNLEVKQTLETNKAKLWVWDWGIIWIRAHIHVYTVGYVTSACVCVCAYLHIRISMCLIYTI